MGRPGLHAEARRLGLDARERALATRLAYGAVQRRATLDHLIEALAGRPVARLEPPVLAALRLGALPARLPRPRARARGRRRVRRARQARLARAAPKLVNAVLRRGAREAAALRRRAADATPAEAALRHSQPEWIAALWWDDARPGRRAGADGRRQRARRGRPARQHAARPTPAELAARAAGRRRTRRRACPRGSCSTAPFDAFDSPLWARGPVHAAVARRDDGRAAARAAPGRARARPVRRARRQDDPSRRADGGPRARSSPSSAIAGRADALRRTAARMGAAARSRSAPATPPPARAGRPTTACSSTRRARTSARSPRAPTRAGARRPTCPRGSRASRRRSCAPAPTRCAPAARSSTRPARSRPPRTRPWSRRSWPSAPDFERRRPALRRAAVGRMGACRASCRRLPHRDGTEGFFIARLRRGRPRERRRAVDLGDVCPACHEPWLRRDEPARPLPLRELPAPLRARVGVPELRRALDDRAHVEHRAVRLQPLPELDAPADLMAASRPGRRAVDPRRGLRPPRRAGRRRCSTPARARSTSTSWTATSCRR